MSPLLARVRFDWLPPEQGGRRTPWIGDRYVPTARIAGDNELFSVIVRFETGDRPNPTQGVLGLLNPDLTSVCSRIHAGTRLDITEGPRKVADCTVIATEVAELS